MQLAVTARQWTRRWIRQRQGPDAAVVRLHRGRIYILPTRLGVVFAAMLLAMLLGSLNYANNLGLALTFLLGALGLVSMHACHRNLDGLSIAAAGTEPPFAGQPAVFRLRLGNPSIAPRIDVEVVEPGGDTRVLSLPAEEDRDVQVTVPTRRRGRIRLERFEVACRYPFGLFRAWAVVHPATDCLVYPRPAAAAPEPPRAAADGASRARQPGEEDFAGLKDYHPGDPPRRIAWKAHARGGDLLVKEFAGDDAPANQFDLDSAPGPDLESRLAVLCRWVVDADARGDAYGMRLPGSDFPTAPGEAQRRRCLDALARFGDPAADHG